MADARLKAVLGHMNNGYQGHMNGHSRFQYTLDNPMLTLEQRQFYEDNGFLVIPRLVSSQFLDACKERFLALCDRRVPWGGITMMKDISLAKNNTVSGERFYNKAQDFVYDEVLFQFCLLPQILDHVSSLPN